MVSSLIPVGIVAMMVSPSLFGSNTVEAVARARLLVVLTARMVLVHSHRVLGRVPLLIGERESGVGDVTEQ